MKIMTKWKSIRKKTCFMDDMSLFSTFALFKSKYRIYEKTKTNFSTDENKLRNLL